MVDLQLAARQADSTERKNVPANQPVGNNNNCSHSEQSIKLLNIVKFTTIVICAPDITVNEIWHAFDIGKKMQSSQSRQNSKTVESVETDANTEWEKPAPPNVFLYIQLAEVKNLPTTIHRLELHLEQGDNIIIKCDEHYNTDACILQDEFDNKPTYTLIFQQDNLERINDAIDNPLIIKLYMRKSVPPHVLRDEEENDYEGDNEFDENASDTETIASARASKSGSKRSAEAVKVAAQGIAAHETEEINYYAEEESLVLLCIGYLDLIGQAAPYRTMHHEELFLYPVPWVPNELRTTVHTKWHLYTLLPIVKELRFTNMAFVTLEAIYNLKANVPIEAETLKIDLSFRSTVPDANREYVVIPWCTFEHMYSTTINQQNIQRVFEKTRGCVPGMNQYDIVGLRSTKALELHDLFVNVLRTEGMEFDPSLIDPDNSEVFACNSFHRYMMTKEMGKILLQAIALNEYVVVVDISQTTEPDVKLFEGILNPAVFIYPEVHVMRFAIQLQYVDTRRRSDMRKSDIRKSDIRKSDLRKSDMRKSDKSVKRRSGSTASSASQPTFAVISICLLAPIGEVYKELLLFRETYLAQKHLIKCQAPSKQSKDVNDIRKIQQEAYTRFDQFIMDTTTYITKNNVFRISDFKPHFCCAVQNLTNMMLKLVGSDFNVRVPTSTNVEFMNLCVVAYNELEKRVHDIIEKAESEGVDAMMNKNTMTPWLIDHMNAAKLMYATGDFRMHSLLIENMATQCHNLDDFQFYTLVRHMECGDFEAAEDIFKQNKQLFDEFDYPAGWIKLYLQYNTIRNDPDTTGNATECLLHSIITYAERFYEAGEIDGWVLLYSYYRLFEYTPGCEYARWQFERKARRLNLIQPKRPLSLWNIMLKPCPKYHSERHELFYTVFDFFMQLGLYEFGKVVFAAVENLFSDPDRYMILSTVNLLLNQLNDKVSCLTFNFDATAEGKRMSACNAQANGNLEYYAGNATKALNFYSRNLNYEPQEGEEAGFLLSTLRLGYLSYASGNYSMTVSAMSKPMDSQLLQLICCYMVGRAYYNLDELEKAKTFFAQATTFGTFVPDIWAYIALINLRQGKNYNALECWKYAKSEPTKFIDDEIYAELDKIDYDTVELYVDTPRFDLV